MIIIIELNTDINKLILPGDNVCLEVYGDDGWQTILKQKITKEQRVTYTALFYFADENGICTNPNICGMFGNKDSLPEEIKNALHFNDLTPEQQASFMP